MSLKYYFYIASSMVLGLMFSFIAHAFLEMAFISYSLKSGNTILPHFIFGKFDCFLPIYASLAIAIAGLIFGYFLGRRWWQIVYIDRRRGFWIKVHDEQGSK